MRISPKLLTRKPLCLRAAWDHRLAKLSERVPVQSDGVKRILGTVPIEEDGSVSFVAPPGAPLHFQLLDVKVDPVSLQKLIAWVDTIAPYRGAEEVREIAIRSSRASIGYRSAPVWRRPRPSSGLGRSTEAASKTSRTEYEIRLL